jgi:ATP-dependent DNA ligase
VADHIKGPRSRYRPGVRGWRKYRLRHSTEAIVGGVTGSRHHPESVLVGRFDPDGRLRYLGRTGTLTDHQATELAPYLDVPTTRRGGGVHHPWPRPLPAGWLAQFGYREPLGYLQVQPTVVVEVHVEAAYEHHRWRHGARYLRVRTDMSIYDVPLAT